MKILTELIGKNNLDPSSMARQFYYRAYFNMGAFGEIFALLGMPRDSLELLMGIEVEGGEKPRFKPTLKTMRHIGRMSRFVWDKWTISVRSSGLSPRPPESMHPSSDKPSRPSPLRKSSRRSTACSSSTSRTAYYNIIVPLLMQMYHRAFKGMLRRLGVDYEQFDMAGGGAEYDVDPNAALASRTAVWAGGTAALPCPPGFTMRSFSRRKESRSSNPG